LEIVLKILDYRQQISNVDCSLPNPPLAKGRELNPGDGFTPLSLARRGVGGEVCIAG
jgi:hypothetical protein